MAIQSDVTNADAWFVGEDKILSFEVLDTDAATPLDVSAFQLEWKIASAPTGTALVTKTSGSGIGVVGSYNVNRLLNTQRVQVTVLATDLSSASPPMVAGTYYYGLRRIDVGQHNVLAFGTVALQESASH